MYRWIESGDLKALNQLLIDAKCCLDYFPGQYGFILLDYHPRYLEVSQQPHQIQQLSNSPSPGYRQNILEPKDKALTSGPLLSSLRFSDADAAEPHCSLQPIPCCLDSNNFDGFQFLVAPSPADSMFQSLHWLIRSQQFSIYSNISNHVALSLEYTFHPSIADELGREAIHNLSLPSCSCCLRKLDNLKAGGTEVSLHRSFIKSDLYS